MVFVYNISYFLIKNDEIVGHATSRIAVSEWILGLNYIKEVEEIILEAIEESIIAIEEKGIEKVRIISFQSLYI